MLKLDFEVTPATILNAFVGAFEGGSTYWLHATDLLSAEKWPDPEHKLVWWGHDNLYEGSFSFYVRYDNPDKEEGNGEGRKLINYPEDVQKALTLMAQKYPRDAADLASENDDSGTHDILMQLIVLGDVIYG